jgi:hypothetical protein
MKKTGFFEEAPGVKSSTRLNTSIIIYIGLAIAVLIVVLDKPAFIGLPISLVGVGAGQKVFQKFAEIKTNKNEEESIDSTDGV